ncbi:MAG: hypothetical protein QW815_00360 [Nitrososphaerota archaeon]
MTLLGQAGGNVVVPVADIVSVTIQPSVFVQHHVSPVDVLSTKLISDTTPLFPVGISGTLTFSLNEGYLVSYFAEVYETVSASLSEGVDQTIAVTLSLSDVMFTYLLSGTGEGSSYVVMPTDSLSVGLTEGVGVVHRVDLSETLPLTVEVSLFPFTM